MTPAMRIAAERYRESIRYRDVRDIDLGESQHVADAETLADEYIAEHPEDDNEPVNVEWLKELRRVGGNMSFLKVRLSDDGFHLMSPCNMPTEGIEGINDYVSQRVATRGDVRRLCAALGIILTERPR